MPLMRSTPCHLDSRPPMRNRNCLTTQDDNSG